jgi:serine protease Do
LGLAVRPLTDTERKEARLASGLVVERVNDGPAQKAGIQTGDVILSVNGELVANPEQLRNKVNGAGKRLAVLVLRDNNRLYIPIHLG